MKQQGAALALPGGFDQRQGSIALSALHHRSSTLHQVC
jgi:hypothetical protein